MEDNGPRRSRRRALLTARATGHCHLPRLKISTEALRHAAYSRSLDNGIPVSQTVLAVCNPNPILQSGVLMMGAISRLCHFAQRCDSDGLPPLGYASGEDHGIGRTRTRVTHQEACDVLVIYLAPLPRGFLFRLGTLVRFQESISRIFLCTFFQPTQTLSNRHPIADFANSGCTSQPVLGGLHHQYCRI